MDVLLRIPALLVRRLDDMGVQTANLATPGDNGPLMKNGPVLITVPKAVSLVIYPPPPVPLRNHFAQVPDLWLELASDWIGAHGAKPPLWAQVISVQFPLGKEDVGQFLIRSRQERASSTVVVSGDLQSNIRTATGRFLGNVPSIALAAGGPSVSDEELVGLFFQLVEVARLASSQAGYAFIAFEPGFGSMDSPWHAAEWAFEEGAPVELSELMCGEIALDAFPYQILGPGHLKRLGRMPAGGHPLEDGRVELSIGKPDAWLIKDFSHPESWRGLSKMRKDKSIQQRARTTLSPCLMREEEVRTYLASKMSEQC